MKLKNHVYYNVTPIGGVLGSFPHPATPVAIGQTLCEIFRQVHPIAKASAVLGLSHPEALGSNALCLGHQMGLSRNEVCNVVYCSIM